MSIFQSDVVDQEPTASEPEDLNVNYAAAQKRAERLRTAKRGLTVLLMLFFIGQFISFTVHYSINAYDADEWVEEHLGEVAAFVWRWVGAEGRSWAVFMRETGLGEMTSDRIEDATEAVKEVVDTKPWYQFW